jgi:hypothetical protein
MTLSGKCAASRRLLRAFLALLTIGWVGFGLFLLAAGLVNIHPPSVVLGAGLLGAAIVARRWILSIWRV